MELPRHYTKKRTAAKTKDKQEVSEIQRGGRFSEGQLRAGGVAPCVVIAAQAQGPKSRSPAPAQQLGVAVYACNSRLERERQEGLARILCPAAVAKLMHSGLSERSQNLRWHKP